MHLYAISDLHLAHEANRKALAAMPYYPEDWLIVAGDVGETEMHLKFALTILTKRFAKVFWTPGNHDLWTLPTEKNAPRGVAKYQQQVAICRDYGVLTPEDPYLTWPGSQSPILTTPILTTPILIAPIFLLYDYSYHPDDVAPDRVLAWAEEEGVVCADELVLHPDPYPTRAAWCAARCAMTEQRLAEASQQGSLILINHFPLRRDLAILPRIPRFSIWCGTRRSDDWHIRFPVHTVVYGHLHIRGSYLRDGVRFEEVSFGYPVNWQAGRGIEHYLRKIL